MKLVTFTNLGFLHYVLMQYYYLCSFNLQDNYIIYFYGSDKDYENLKRCNLKCELRRFKSTFFNFDNSKIDMNKIVYCGEDLSYNRFCAYKLESFFKVMNEFGSATYLDPDQAILENLYQDLKCTLGDSAFALKIYTNTPTDKQEMVLGKLVNLGIISANKCNESVKYLNQTFKLLQDSHKDKHNLDEVIFTKIMSDKTCFNLISDKINLLNNEKKYFNKEEIIGYTKSFHPTFISGPTKIDILINLDRWCNEIFVDNLNYIRVLPEVTRKLLYKRGLQI